MYTIPIHGIIGEREDENDNEKYVDVGDIATHVNNAASHESIMLDIKSVGGEVYKADKMIELIKSLNKPIYSKNSGDVASAAVGLFLLAPYDNRTYNPNMGVFLIHNPWGGATGDSSELKEAASELQAIENRYAKYYSEATGAEESVIKALMAEDKPLTTEQVEQLRFAKIVYPTIKAVAKFNNKNKSEMSEKKQEERLSFLEKAIAKIGTTLEKLTPKSELTVNKAGGGQVVFPEIASIDELIEGVSVTVDGSPAEGEIVLEDGRVLVCEAGKVVEIRPAESDAEALARENEDLKAKISELESANSELVSAKAVTDEAVEAVRVEMQEVKEVYAKLKGTFSKGEPKGQSAPSSGKKYEPKKLKFGKSNKTI